MKDVTILYYTSNKENPEFENKIKKNLLNVCGGLPIISVSHKPIRLGKNIVVGDIGVSGFNMFRQVQIACEAATTKFVVSAEADCLYPPDYFTFIPLRDNVCYRHSDLFVLRIYRNVFHRKRSGATHAQIVGREFYLKTLNELFKGAPKWSIEEKNFPRERLRKVDVFDKIEYYKTKNPIVQIKTKDSMRFYTACFEDKVYDHLPYWGTVKQMKKKYL